MGDHQLLRGHRAGHADGGCGSSRRWGSDHEAQARRRVLRGDRRPITLFMRPGSEFPVSTTHTITGAIVGSAPFQKFSAVRWGIAGNIVWHGSHDSGIGVRRGDRVVGRAGIHAAVAR